VLSKDGPTYVQDLKAGSTYNTIDSAPDFTPDNYSDLKQGDIIETFEEREIPRT